MYNVITKYPKHGDILVLDADKQKRFITLESYSDIALPASWTKVGVVEWVRGRKCFCVHKTNSSQKWAEKFLWKIEGYSLDGADHSVTFTINKVSCSVTYNATDIASLASQLNAVVKATDFGGHSYSVYERGGVLVLQHDTYTTYLGVTASGVSVSAYVGSELTATATMERYNGARSGEGAVINLNRALISFMSDTSSEAYNPSTDITSLSRTYPICLPAYLGTSQYQSDHCAFLRAYYGEGEEGWLKFMQRQMAVNPSSFGIMPQDGKTNTYALAGQTYTDRDSGEQKPLYPAFDYAAAVGYDCDGLREGDWYLPSMSEVADIMEDVTYPAKYENGASKSVARADADPVNRALNAIGGSSIGNSSYVWSSCRSSTISAWYCLGNGGFAGSYYFYVRLLAVPSVLLDLA